MRFLSSGLFERSDFPGRYRKTTDRVGEIPDRPVYLGCQRPLPDHRIGGVSHVTDIWKKEGHHPDRRPSQWEGLPGFQRVL